MADLTCRDSLFPHGGCRGLIGKKVELDYSVCVNPLGMPPAAARAAVEAISECGNYPDPRSRDLIRALAAFHGLPDRSILPGNGAAELVFALCLLLRPDRVICPVPGFGEYRRAAIAAGSRIVELRRGPEDGFALPHDLTDRLRLWCSGSGNSLLFLTNPDHPAGAVMTREAMAETAEVCEELGIWLCVDECFLPFLDEEEELSLLKDTASLTRLLVLRAFTKIYGMAGLRLGYLVSGNEKLLSGVRGRLQPWNVSVPAQQAGAAALTDNGYIRRTRQLIREEREYLLREMEAGLSERVFGGRANYLFFEAERGLKERLLTEGILIRSFEEEFDGGNRYYRIGIRSHAENTELIRRWRTVVHGYREL